MFELSPGQQLAIDQLKDIAVRANGALEILGEPEERANGAFLRFRLSLDMDGYRTDIGFNFRSREQLILSVHSDFPFTKPDLYFNHKRFIGQPHVQWGDSICLYQSVETEYQPSDGLFGFFQRIHAWMTAAGSGQLDPDDAPLHPPVAYPTSSTRFVIKADTPPELPSEQLWIGCADLKKVRDTRFDVVGWTALEDFDDHPDHPIAAAVFLKQPIASEYPKKIYDLIQLVEKAGLSFPLLFRLLRLFALFTPEGEAGRFIFGAPMRRKSAGEEVKPHLTVWEVPPEPLAALREYVNSNETSLDSKEKILTWLAGADVKWCYVMEDRPEIVHRRDSKSIAAGLNGRRVLLLGCGALGTAVAESVIRAGASKLHLIDNAIVKAGVLVRQRYADNDIGQYKSMALKKHMDALEFPCEVTNDIADLEISVISKFEFEDWDLVIDATASAMVHHRIERELVSYPLPVPLVSLSVSAAANHGSVIVKMPNYFGGPRHIARQAKLEAFSLNGTHSLVKAFWPNPQDIKIFQPEPGCSAPTFRGSAIDIDHHAGGLLNLGLRRIQTLSSDYASLDLISAPWIENELHESYKLAYAFTSYEKVLEKRSSYTVFRSDVALQGMKAELNRIAREHSDKVETGGLIFGEIDDSHRQIWIDSVSGPPSDSSASSAQFLCGTAGAKELAAFKAKSSGESSKFIGIWHTHPVSKGSPSNDDLFAMLALLHLQDVTPRQIVMLIVGYSASHPVENYYLYRRNEIKLIAYEDYVQGRGLE